jgi:hypothetical protein
MTPLACNLDAFDPSELPRYRRARQAVHAAVRDISELADGYRLNLGTGADTFLTAAEWIALERRCCPFLRFALELTDEGQVWLSLTGADGVKAFLGDAIRPQRLPGA